MDLNIDIPSLARHFSGLAYTLPLRPHIRGEGIGFHESLFYKSDSFQVEGLAVEKNEFASSLQRSGNAEDIVAYFESEIRKLGFSHFERFKYGLSSIVIVGFHRPSRTEMAISFSRNSYVDPPDEFFDFSNLVRPPCPFIVQPQIILGEDMAVTASIMPLLKSIRFKDFDGKTRNALQALFDYLTEGTCFGMKLSKETVDMLVLPDGTPLVGDPDMVSFFTHDYEAHALHEEDKANIEQALNLIAERSAELNLQEPLRWLSDDGQFRQKEFFPTHSQTVATPGRYLDI